MMKRSWILWIAVGVAISGVLPNASATSGRSTLSESGHDLDPEGSSATTEELEIVGQIGRASSAVAVDGNYAYIGAGPRLSTVSLAGSTALTTRGYSAAMAGSIQGVDVADSIAYVASGDAGLHLIDVSSETSQTTTGRVDTPGNAMDVAVAENLAFVADAGAGLQVIDVTTPSAPRIVARVDTPGEALGVAVAGNLVYVADAVAGLQVIDMTVPGAASITGGIDTPGGALDVAVAGNFAYVADGAAGLQVIDATTPSAPTIVGHVDTINDAVDISIVGGRVYVAIADAGLQVIDVTTPHAPRSVGRVDTTDMALGVAAIGTRAYVADGDAGLQVIDVTTASAPRVALSVTAPVFALDVIVADKVAYVTDEAGLQVIDVAVPSAPQIIGGIDTPGASHELRVFDSGRAITITRRHQVLVENLLYIADWQAGLRVIDVAVPSAPRILGGVDTSGNVMYVAVAGEVAAALSIGGGGIATLYVVDVAIPSAPKIVSSLEFISASGVAIVDDMIYVGASSGLVVIDITIPSAPRQVGEVDTQGLCYSITVAGDLAFCVADKLHILDATIPSNPRIVGGILVGNGELEVIDNLVTVTTYNQIAVIDVAVPSAPQIVARVDPPGHASDAAFEVASGQMYIADLDYGLIIAKLDGLDNGSPTPLTSPTPVLSPTWTPTPVQTPAPSPTPTRGPSGSTCGGANFLAPGSPLPERIDTAGEVDNFSFHVPEPFTQARITLDDPADALDMLLYRDCTLAAGTGSGRHIGTGSGRHIGPGQRQLVFDVLSQTGEYHLSVQTRPGIAASYPVSYSVQVERMVPDPADIHTLILTSRNRVALVTGAPQEEMDAWQASLAALARHPRVKGRIVWNLDSGGIEGTNREVEIAYDDWTDQPYDVRAANAVATAIRDWVWGIRRKLPNLAYVVIAGDDRVVPSYRVRLSPRDGADDGWLGEQDYLSAVGRAVDVRSTVGSALAQNRTLSDDVYGAPAPVPVANDVAAVGGLHVPEIAVGRLVERPAQMGKMADDFVASDGLVSVRTSLSAGWDHMSDGVAAGDAILRRAGLPDAARTLLQGDAWQQAALQTHLFSERRDLIYLGMHAEHFRMLLPDTTALRPADVIAAPNDMAAALVYTLACHAGLNTPGTSHGEPLDFPEAWSRRGTTYIGTTGWAYGGPVGIGYQEALMAAFAQALVQGSGTAVGDALVAAKQSYFEHHHQPLSAIHAKTIAGTVLYGLPMVRVQLETTGQPTASPTPSDVAVSAPPVQSLNEQTAVQRGRSYRFAATAFGERSDPRGGRYQVFGRDGIWADAGQPVQPRHVDILTEASLAAGRYLPPRGVVLRDAAYRDVADFEPVVQPARVIGAAPASGRVAALDPTGWLPSVPVAIARLERTPGTGARRFVAEEAVLQMTLGQYHAGRATERLYSELTLDAYYSDAADHLPPAVEGVRGQRVGNALSLAVQARDASGVETVVIASFGENGHLTSATLDWRPATQAWGGIVPVDGEFLVQVVDRYGNVAVADHGGRYFTAADLEPSPQPLAARIFLPVALSEHCKQVRVGIDVALVMDLSTSMNRKTAGGRTRLEAALAAARQFMGALRLEADDPAGSDRVAIVAFNQTAWTEVGLTDRLDVLNLALSDLAQQTAPGTRLDLAFSEATSVLHRRAQPGRELAMIVLTDGLPTGVDDASVLAAAESAKTREVRVYAIGLGPPAAGNPEDRIHVDLLRQCASHPSMFFTDPDAEALARIYTQIASSIGCSPADFWGWR